MTLRTRLLIAQAPLAVALAVVAVITVVTTRALGHAGERILADNYRSVLAAQRMKESIERLDSGALFVVIGERQRGVAWRRSTVRRSSTSCRSRSRTSPRPARRARPRRCARPGPGTVPTTRASSPPRTIFALATWTSSSRDFSG